MICNLFPAPTFLIFSPDVPSLLYYAHIPTVIVALFFGIFLFRNGKNQLLNRLLFAISVLIFLWTATNLIAWTNIHSNLIMFVWSLFGSILGFIAILSVYFIYVFLEKKDISGRVKGVFLAILAPLIILAPTSLNISGFDISVCDAFQFEWPPYKVYSAIVGGVAFLWILILLVRKYRIALPDFKKQIVLMGTGIELFLFMLFGMEFLAAFLTKIGLLPDSGIEIYGMFGMVVFIIYINILIVRFGVFNVKLIATQALVLGLIILIGSEFFFIKQRINFILNGVTFAASSIFGYLLIQSVKKEVLQKERLAILSVKLEESNEKLKGLDKMKTEFLSLASHQLRSPLTAIKGYASMLDEGSLGSLTPEQDTATKRIYASAQGLVNLVEDLLNVSKIEQGGMKYEMLPVELAKIVTDLAGEMKIPAENKGLELRVAIALNDAFATIADPVKLKQVFLNLVDNSIKYTTAGFVEIGLARGKKNEILFTVRDSGVGVTAETKATLFQKFSRGGEGSKMNTGGSGLGLYLAQEIAKAHNGTITVDSEGLGKGSTFTVTLPATKSTTKSALKKA